MEINGYTRTCGLIGNPVEHTMSPVIHNFLAQETGENLVYVPFRVPSGKIKEAVEGAAALNLLGVNVTVPYKSDVLPFLQEIDPLAERIGAVNTLVRCEGGFRGYNTDMPGLYRAMCQDGVSIKGEEILLLGAGGVARAVALLLAEKQAGRIFIINRTMERAAQIADLVNRYAGHELAEAMTPGEALLLPGRQRYLAIQATNVGMFPDVDKAVIEDRTFYEKLHTGYDLIFNPEKTKFMQLTQAAGGRAFNGSKMLLYQGIIAYELWTGQKISDELAAQAYEKMK